MFCQSESMTRFMAWCGWKPGVFLLTVYYAVLAGVGPGFHVLFDPHHHSHSAGQAAETPTATAPAGHAGCRHCHHHDQPRAEQLSDCCAVSQRDAVNPKSRLPSVRPAGHEHDHDCQLCQWYAQSQSNGLARATEFCIQSVIYRNDSATSLCMKEVACQHLSRGPPAAA